MDGVFLINKQVGWTSFDVCAKMRKKMDTKKVGHTGTLDPFAEGLMIVTLGKATKIIPYLETLDKEYIAELKLGEVTDTLDLTGKFINQKPIPELDDKKIVEVLDTFLGEQEQVPPMFSALKYNGLPLYALAREGIEVERKPRKINVFEIELISYIDNIIKFRCVVSKGTYIRTLANDIAEKLGTVGHLVSLKRTKIGKFKINQTKTIDELDENDKISIEEMLSFMTIVVVNDIGEKRVRNGMRLSFNSDSSLVLIKNKVNELLAIYERREDGFYYTKRGMF